MSLQARGMGGGATRTRKIRESGSHAAGCSRSGGSRQRAGLSAAGALALALIVGVAALGVHGGDGLMGMGSVAQSEGSGVVDGGPPAAGDGLAALGGGEPAEGTPTGDALGDVDRSVDTGREPTTVDELFARLDVAEVVGGSSRATALLPGEVPDVAVLVLDTYRSGSPCLLAYEGYLDLSGSAWGCVVEGEGWVDVGVVQAQDGLGSQVSVTRMQVDAWAEDPEGLLGEVLDEV